MLSCIPFFILMTTYHSVIYLLNESRVGNKVVKSQ